MCLLKGKPQLLECESPTACCYPASQRAWRCSHRPSLATAASGTNRDMGQDLLGQNRTGGGFLPNPLFSHTLLYSQDDVSSTKRGRRCEVRKAEQRARFVNNLPSDSSPSHCLVPPGAPGSWWASPGSGGQEPGNVHLTDNLPLESRPLGTPRPSWGCPPEERAD